jgi:hypothetical protein
MHPDHDQCCEAEPAHTFYDPNGLRASLLNTLDAADQRINELEKELYAQRLLRDATTAGLSTLDQPVPGSIHKVGC